jgi:hypothetical protein
MNDAGAVDIAVQLVTAFVEAETADDEDYAAESIGDFLSEVDGDTPADALLALLYLPSTDITDRYVREAEAILAGRGPGVVEILLLTSLGLTGADSETLDHTATGLFVGNIEFLLRSAVRNPDRDVLAERAVEIMSAMHERDLVVGLVEVISGGARKGVKEVAVDGLVAIGRPAVDDLLDVRDDDIAGAWARKALGFMALTPREEAAMTAAAEGDDEKEVPGRPAP